MLELERGEAAVWRRAAGISCGALSHIVNGTRQASRTMAKKLSATSLAALGRFIPPEKIRIPIPSVEDLI